jgi:small subunit ribosomal protein S6
LRKYEVMLILPPEADDQVIQGVTDRISQVLEAQGGKVGAVNKWGKRRLAFVISHQSEGFYVVAEFEAEPETVKELDRVLALVDDVIRFKVVVHAA